MKRFLLCLALVGAIVAVASADMLPEADAVRLDRGRLRWARLPAGGAPEVRAALRVQLADAGWRAFVVTNAAEDFPAPRLAWDFTMNPVRLWWTNATTTATNSTP